MTNETRQQMSEQRPTSGRGFILDQSMKVVYQSILVLALYFLFVGHNLPGGGFIGVDIFFVISGFLITGILSRALYSGNFSLLEFYRRRIKRILPALSLVVICTLIAGQFILLPGDLVGLSKSAIAAQLFSANIYFT